jgi:hypothetical protein
MPRNPTLSLCLVFSMAFLAACAQWWEVRPYPEFVDAEIRPGDTVRIETRNGEQSKLVVVDVRSDRIIGESETILHSDISRLEKHSETPPANPCSPQVPLGCSVPQWAAVLHESQARYSEFFYPSCEQHDYCYRHGEATYGKSKNVCDSEFLLDMQDQCRPDTVKEVFMLQAGNGYTSCGAVALEFYIAVQKYGAGRYRTGAGSTRCEYDGPP